MDSQELERLEQCEKRIDEIAEAEGLMRTEISFEIVPPDRMLTGMAYNFPKNFSHWTFGRDYDRHRMVYDQTGQGVPYEQVWNFDNPRALIMATNPFPVKVLTMAHVYGHVDYFLASNYLKFGRHFADIADEARSAATLFKEYEARYGPEVVEATIDSGMSIAWQQPPNPFHEEEFDEELTRERLLEYERERLRSYNDFYSQFKQQETREQIKKTEVKLKFLGQRKPPEPMYDLLGYILHHSPILKSWQKEVLSVIRNQARTLAPNMRTKMLNEGWASFWHVRIMRQLVEEGFITKEEHGVFNNAHSSVVRPSQFSFNWYNIGLSLFEYIEERWDRGMFGTEYDNCKDPHKKAYWDTKAMKGREKIFQVRAHYSDRMAVEEFFTDEFIRRMQLYIYEEVEDHEEGQIVDAIWETDPEIIRRTLMQGHVLYGMQPVKIVDADYNRRQELYLVHDYHGAMLDHQYLEGTLIHLHRLWGRKVHLSTKIVTDKDEEKDILFSFDGEKLHTQIQ